MTSKTALPDKVTLTILDNVDTPWWPNAASPGCRWGSYEMRRRVISLAGKLCGDAAILNDLEGRPGPRRPTHDLINSYIGTVLAALSGDDVASSSVLTPAIVHYVQRYAVDDEQERAAWKRASTEFQRTLSPHQQRQFVKAVVDRYEEVGANLAGHRARVRGFDEFLSRVETWLKGGAK